MSSYPLKTLILWADCAIMIRHTVAGIREILRIKRGNYALQELARAIVCKGVVIPFCITAKGRLKNNP